MADVNETTEPARPPAIPAILLMILPGIVLLIPALAGHLRDGVNATEAVRSGLYIGGCLTGVMAAVAVFVVSRGALGRKDSRKTLYTVSAALLVVTGIESLTGLYVFFRFPPNRQFTHERLESPLLQEFEWAASVTAAGDSLQYAYAPVRLWKVKPMRTQFLNVEPDGSRATVLPEAPSDAEPYVVDVYGGSTVFCLEVADEWTLPSRLAVALAARLPERKVIVRNRGVPSYTREQQLVWMRQNLGAEQPPDLLVFYDGGNDMLFCGWRGLRHFDQIRFEKAMEGDRPTPLRATFDLLARVSHTGTAVSFHRERLTAPERTPDQSRIDSEAREAAKTYVGHGDSARALARQAGVDIVFFLQPSLYGKPFASFNEQAFIKHEAAYRPGIRSFDAGFRAAVRELEKSSGRSDFFDLSEVFHDRVDDAYFDTMHVGPRENDMIAKAIERRARADSVSGKTRPVTGLRQMRDQGNPGAESTWPSG